nr:hypothetical protein [Tanacetum cinerariifolium]
MSSGWLQVQTVLSFLLVPVIPDALPEVAPGRCVRHYLAGVTHLFRVRRVNEYAVENQWSGGATPGAGARPDESRRYRCLAGAIGRPSSFRIPARLLARPAVAVRFSWIGRDVDRHPRLRGRL